MSFLILYAVLLPAIKLLLFESGSVSPAGPFWIFSIAASN